MVYVDFFLSQKLGVCDFGRAFGGGLILHHCPSPVL